eukprot:TRINITY_DN18206_c0_g1_i1.p1 TRINITY_DN18206_c0_g1~~TRINITY_DN18206_c0_g1_i1.p1  ORF type:complete len:247 (+),score=47.06 TRINITY_DN18206_c0_g1_i1:80-820(+)
MCIRDSLLCLYGDTLAAILLFILVRGKSGVKYDHVHTSVGSIFMHGLAHGALWSFQPRGGSSLAEHMSPLHQAGLFVLLTGFYYAFVHAAWKIRGASPQSSLVQSVIHAIAGTWYIPPVYAFTYANTVIVLNGLGAQLASPPKEKDASYDVRALCCAVPPVLVSWLEPLACDSLLIDLGGHAWFDMSIPAGVLVYFFFVTNLEPQPLFTVRDKGDRLMGSVPGPSSPDGSPTRRSARVARLEQKLD